MRLMIILAALSCAACKSKVDTKRYENQIQKDLKGIGIDAEKVECPKDVQAKQGETFVCQITIEGKAYGFEATIDSVDGSDLKMSTHWVDGHGMVGKKIEDALAKDLTAALGAVTQVDCGEPLRFLDADNALKCKATVLAHTFEATIKFDDKREPTGWTLDPAPVPVAKMFEVLLPSVRATLGPAAEVTCGDQPFVIVPPDGHLLCQVSAGNNAKSKLDVVFKPGTTELERWEVVP